MQRLLLCLLLAAWAACAQTTIQDIPGTENISTSRGKINANFLSLAANKIEGASSSVDDGMVCFSGTDGKAAKACIGILPPTYTVATLPASPATGTLAWVSDGASASDCTTGSGSTRVLCAYGGASWAVWGGGGGGGALEIEVGGTAEGQESVLDVVPSAGMLITGSNPSGKVQLTFAPDTAVLLTRSQAQSGQDLLCAPATSDSDEYECSLAPTLGGYSTGMVLHFRPDVANASGGITLDVDALGPKAIKEADCSTDPDASALAAGILYPLWYNGTAFCMQAAPVSGGGGGSSAFTKGVTISAPTSSEDVTLFYTDVAITITQLNAVVRGSGSPSVTWTIRFAADRSDTGTEVVTGGTTTTSQSTGSEVTSFDDATIPAGSWIWLETTAEADCDEFHLTILAEVD